MAESAVTHLLDKLAQFFENEVWFLTGAREEALSVRGELERIRAFLRVADSLEESDMEVQVWVKQLINIAYDMEDALDEFSLVLRHDHGVGFTGLINRMSCCIKNLKARYRVTSEIQSIHSRVKGICDGHRRLRHKFRWAQQDPSSTSTDNTWMDNRGNALLLDKTGLVGIEQPKNELIGQLLDGVHRREVISVLGMGGLGKTTLVKQVFEDPSVKKHFAVYAWITLSRPSEIEELLKDMLDQIVRVMRKPVPPGANAMNSDWLKMIINDQLQRRRYLIVLDDAWYRDKWDAVMHALPNNDHGSRVIITTRNADLASTSCKEFNGLVKNMEPLNPEQSWKLFCQRTFQKNSCPSHLEEICEYILGKCDGLPFAIMAISGVLAAKDKQRIDEWDALRCNLRAEIDGNNRLKNLKRVLSLSFSDLPYYLKSCFLHLSVFPEGHLIERRRLTRLWVAEGFVERREGKTLDEVAKEYFSELLNRSLVQVAETTTDRRVRLCRIHDFQREIITSKSSDQSFATITKEQTDMWPNKVRRLSLHNSLQAAQQNRSLSRLRSLYMFGVDRGFIDFVLGCDIKLLNVLDMQATPLSRFPVQVVDCYYLRYLNLRHTEVKTIPTSIGRLQNLETLDLKYTNVTRLPVEIFKLQKLQHLLVYRYANISYLCYKYGFKALTEIGALQSLQKLCYIEANDERNDILMRELGKLTQLSRLGILKLRKEDGRALCSSIEKLTNLCALSVASVEDDEILDLQHLTSPPQLLQRIYLRGRLKMIPNWLATLDSLVKLLLRMSRLKDDPLALLQSLPNLIHLELLQVFEGKTLCFKSKGFRKLRILGLDNFDGLRSVEVEEGAMPCLEKLIIQRCKLLEKLPSGIEYLTKLRVLEFFDMPDQLVKEVYATRA
ncbi:disease resistance protein RPM1 [Eucalyptus grandis]|uniref:disease resistance protein RPM1 n=1 Tax=Eucalyptus grandis TaxID=71139 RepID=UPI00192E8369|nr:disease resistance protein RPM1 [Eucalyptus grandis]